MWAEGWWKRAGHRFPNRTKSFPERVYVYIYSLKSFHVSHGFKILTRFTLDSQFDLVVLRLMASSVVIVLVPLRLFDKKIQRNAIGY
jgi:hypothetical protein